MTTDEAAKKLNDINASVNAGFGSIKEVTDYINYLDVVWDFGVTETNNRYEVFEKDLH